MRDAGSGIARLYGSPQGNNVSPSSQQLGAATAVGFCIGSARIITSFGPLAAGLLVGAFGGSFNRVTAFMTCFALLSIVAMLLGRETKGDPLPR
jgi:hypothetical protein